MHPSLFSRVSRFTPTTRRLQIGSAVLIMAALTSCAAEEDRALGDQGTSVRNCSMEVTVDGPPERAYAAYQPAIEVAHALGISDRLVETAFLDSQVLPEHEAAQRDTKYVEMLPSREALLSSNPDFILSGFNGVFAEGNATGFGTRGSLAELGVQSWILSPLCPSEDGLTDEAIDPSTVDVESIHEDLRSLGVIFDVEEKAEEVIRDQTTRIQAVQAAVEGAEQPRVAIVTAREDGTFSVAGGSDFGTQVIELAGGTNVFADLTEARNNQIDIEELLKRDPDVILTSKCCDASYVRSDAKEDVETLVKLPALSGMAAVKNKQVHAFLFADRAAGVRAAHAIELVASILHPDLVD